ncbi:conserved hypothetical protein [Neospora caninum Liverpool]|nr:conserved hypothetical protein [Neospora caninum Liverpool]CBZ50601.1 conserved hypothetical protein [Neospora caninum Liverpool]|eukprot:XP_003880634.1 conserved hypothetical protein [Neospora caninum Liverpool]
MEGYGSSYLSSLQAFEGGPSATPSSNRDVLPLSHSQPFSSSARSTQLFPSFSLSAHVSYQPADSSSSEVPTGLAASSQSQVLSSHDGSAVSDVSSCWDTDSFALSSSYAVCSSREPPWPQALEGPAVPHSPFLPSPSCSLSSFPSSVPSPTPAPVSSSASEAVSSSVFAPWLSRRQVPSGAFDASVDATSGQATAQRSDASTVSPAPACGSALALLPCKISSSSRPPEAPNPLGQATADLEPAGEKPVYGHPSPSCSWNPYSSVPPYGAHEPPVSPSPTPAFSCAFPASRAPKPAAPVPTAAATDRQYGGEASYAPFEAYPVSSSPSSTYVGYFAAGQAEPRATCDAAMPGRPSRHRVAGPSARALEEDAPHKGRENSAFSPGNKLPLEVATTSCGSDANASFSVHANVSAEGRTAVDAAVPLPAASFDPAVSQNGRSCFTFGTAPGPVTEDSSSPPPWCSTDCDCGPSQNYEERRAPGPVTAPAAFPTSLLQNRDSVPAGMDARLGLPSFSSSLCSASSVAAQIGVSCFSAPTTSSFDVACATTDLSFQHSLSPPSSEACGAGGDTGQHRGPAALPAQPAPVSAQAPYSAPSFPLSSSACPLGFSHSAPLPSFSSVPFPSSSRPWPPVASPASSGFKQSARHVDRHNDVRSAGTEGASASASFPAFFRSSPSSSTSLLQAAATLGSLWWRSTCVEAEADGRRRRGASLTKAVRPCEGEKKRDEKNAEKPELPGLREKVRLRTAVHAGGREATGLSAFEQAETDEGNSLGDSQAEGAPAGGRQANVECRVGTGPEEEERRRGREENEKTHFEMCRKTREGDPGGEGEPGEDEADRETANLERENTARENTARENTEGEGTDNATAGAGRARVSCFEGGWGATLAAGPAPDGDSRPHTRPREADGETQERALDWRKRREDSSSVLTARCPRTGGEGTSREKRGNSGEASRDVGPEQESSEEEQDHEERGTTAKAEGGYPTDDQKREAGSPSAYSPFSSSLPFVVSPSPQPETSAAGDALEARDKKGEAATLEETPHSPRASIASSPTFSADSFSLSPSRIPRSSPLPGWGLAMMRRLLAGAMSDIDGEEDSDFSLSEDEGEDDCFEDEEFEAEDLAGTPRSSKRERKTSLGCAFAPQSLLTGHFPSEEEDSDYTAPSGEDSASSLSSGGSSRATSPSFSSRSPATSPSLSPASPLSASPLSPVKTRGPRPRARRPRSLLRASCASSSRDLSPTASEGTPRGKRTRKGRRTCGASERRRKRRCLESRQKGNVSLSLGESDEAAEAGSLPSRERRTGASRLQATRKQRPKHRSRTRGKSFSPFSSCAAFPSSLPSPSSFWSGGHCGSAERSRVASKKAKKEGASTSLCSDIQTASASVVPPPFPLAHVAHLVPQLKNEASSSTDSFSPILNGFSARQLRRLKGQMDLYVQLLMQTIYVIRNRCYGDDERDREAEREEDRGEGEGEREDRGARGGSDGEAERREQGNSGLREANMTEQKDAEGAERREGVKETRETKRQSGEKLMRRAMMCCDRLIRGRLEQVNELRARQDLAPLELQERLPFLETPSPVARTGLFALPLASASPFSPGAGSASSLLAASPVGRVVDDSSGLVPFSGLATRTAAISEGEGPRCSLLDFPLLRKIKQFLLLLEDRDSRFPRPLEEFLRLQQPFVDPAFLTGCYQKKRKQVPGARGPGGALSSSSSARESTADGPGKKGDERNGEANGGE